MGRGLLKKTLELWSQWGVQEIAVNGEAWAGGSLHSQGDLYGLE